MTAKFRVLIADDLSPRGVEILRTSPAIDVDIKVGLSPQQLAATISPYHGLVVRSATKVTAPLLEAASQLQIIGRAGIGVDNIDVPAASRRGVIVENTPSGNAVTTAEHALTLLLALARNVPQATASMKAGKWERKKFQGVELLDKTLGIIGLGNIGRLVADRARGLKMAVIAHDPFISQEAARTVGAELVSLLELFARADFITIHTTLTVDTRGLLNRDAFAAMKPGVLIVNCARGEITDENALLEALETGRVGGAALDVFTKEPTPPESPLVHHERVICTPHLGASTEEAQERVAREIAAQLVGYFERKEITNAVNIAAIRTEVLPRLQPWMELAKRLGALIGQIHPRNASIDEVHIEIMGEVGEWGTTPVTHAALTGLLRTYVNTPVNEVNAPLIAAERGLQVTEVKRHQALNFANAVGITTHGRDASCYVRGTLFQVGDRNEPRIVQIDEFVLDATPDGRLLVVHNVDKPGVIGAVGTLLGQNGINVARLHVGRSETKGSALMLWNVESEVAPSLLEDIRQLPNMQFVKQVVL